VYHKPLVAKIISKLGSDQVTTEFEGYNSSRLHLARAAAALDTVPNLAVARTAGHIFLTAGVTSVPGSC